MMVFLLISQLVIAITPVLQIPHSVVLSADYHAERPSSAAKGLYGSCSVFVSSSSWVAVTRFINT